MLSWLSYSEGISAFILHSSMKHGMKGFESSTLGNTVFHEIPTQPSTRERLRICHVRLWDTAQSSEPITASMQHYSSVPYQGVLIKAELSKVLSMLRGKPKIL